MNDGFSIFKMDILTFELSVPCQFFDHRTLINVLNVLRSIHPMVAQFIYILPLGELALPLLRTTKLPLHLALPSPALVM